MKPEHAAKIHIFILAGGLSSRMGRDKAGLKVGQDTMLAHIRRGAAEVLPTIRVVRRDMVPRCGPLGGVVTAFRRSRADAILFLACDMPHVRSHLLQTILAESRLGLVPAFTECAGRPGFPFLLPRSVLPTVEHLRANGEFALRRLADAVDACRVAVDDAHLVNVNRPEDYAALLARWPRK